MNDIPKAEKVAIDAMAEYLKGIKVKSGGIANLPFMKDNEAQAVAEGLINALSDSLLIRLLVDRGVLVQATEPVGSHHGWKYLKTKDGKDLFWIKATA